MIQIIRAYYDYDKQKGLFILLAAAFITESCVPVDYV